MDLQSRRNLICGQSNNNNCVKDKNNIVSFNQWSCGQYMGLTGILSNTAGAVSITNETFTIGNSCLKLTPPINAQSNCAMGVSLEFTEEDLGKTLTAYVDLKTTSPRAYLQIRTPNISNLCRISIPITDWATYNISYEITSTTMYVWTYISPDNQTDMLMDNFRINIQ